MDFWIKDKAAKDSYKGILKQVSDWNTGLDKNTVILFDMVGLGSIADNLKKSGHLVYGAGKLNDSLELNREFGIKMAQNHGLKVPLWKRFDSFDKAKTFISKADKAWVFKPLNNSNPANTYVSQDAKDMRDMLLYFEENWQGKVDFILQEKIDGVEMSVEMFYFEGNPVPNTLNSTLECKRFMEGDKGSNTGCMGSVVRFWKNPAPKIYRLTLAKIEKFLKQFKYSGPLDCNCMISKADKMPYFLEWTARFGYNAIYALCEGINTSLGEFITINSKKKPLYDWLGSVRVSVAPYPNDTKATANIPIGFTDNEHIWPLDVMMKNGRMVTAGVDGVVCEITGRNETLSGMGNEIYNRIKKLKIPDMQYRSDIVSSAETKINKLKEWKYL